MLDGVAIRDTASIVEGRWTRERTRMRDGRPEMYFLVTDADRVLPVYLGGRSHVLRWSSRRGQSGKLPTAAWAEVETLALGQWHDLEPVDAVIPASRALDNDVWYDVREGTRAIVVCDGDSRIVYPLVEPASHYYRAMTESEWMPCLVRQRI